MKVENLNGYANQFLITDDFGDIAFNSYNSHIAKLYNSGVYENKLFLKSNMWDYSNTTRRHFKSFINEHTPFTYENKAQWLKEIETNNNIEVI